MVRYTVEQSRRQHYVIVMHNYDGKYYSDSSSSLMAHRVRLLSSRWQLKITTELQETNTQTNKGLIITHMHQVIMKLTSNICRLCKVVPHQLWSQISQVFFVNSLLTDTLGLSSLVVSGREQWTF